jgi:hypothetical protein
MFYLSLFVTLFVVCLSHALCLESKLCNVPFIMDDDIISDCSARGLNNIPRDCPGNRTQLIMTETTCICWIMMHLLIFLNYSILTWKIVTFQKQDKRRLPN